MQRQILALDMAGTPRKWVSAENAVAYYAKGMVAYEFGAAEMIFHGGWQRNGERSCIRVSNIVAVRGPEYMTRDYSRAPLLTSDKLYTRDRHLCAYCGEQYREALPNARLEIIAGAGHAVEYEETARVASLIAAHARA